MFLLSKAAIHYRARASERCYRAAMTDDPAIAKLQFHLAARWFAAAAKAEANYHEGIIVAPAKDRYVA